MIQKYSTRSHSSSKEKVWWSQWLPLFNEPCWGQGRWREVLVEVKVRLMDLTHLTGPGCLITMLASMHMVLWLVM